jgi:capsular polysaccharide biosynthesis protein
MMDHRQKTIEKLIVRISELEEKLGISPTWMPPELEKDERPLFPKSLKNTKIGIVQETTPTGTLRLIYRKFFKRFVIMRRLFQWVWRHGYPIYANNAAKLSLRQRTKWRSLISLGEYSKKTGLTIHKLTNTEVVKTPPPIVFPASYQNYLESPHDQYEFPEVSVVVLENGMINGGSNLVLVDGYAICHDLFDPVQDCTSEELHGRAIIDPGSMRIRCLSHDNEPVKLQKAATFVDACASNYAHWLTEVLPRVVLFCLDERYKTVPIVVNAGLHQNILDSLLDVAGFEREIIQLSVERTLCVRELYITSVAGYVPFDRRKKNIQCYSHGKFSPDALGMLSRCMSNLHNISKGYDSPEKVFIRRNSGSRKVINESQIEKLLVAEGYLIVEPEKLTFSQQVQVFSNAKSVIGSSGAALANMIFLPSNAHIVILIGQYSDTSYWYWQNIACASGNLVNYVFGSTKDSKADGIHSDFSINPSDLAQAINKLGEG